MLNIFKNYLHYEINEKIAYFHENSKFEEKYKGKYVLVKDPEYSKDTLKQLYLVDRHKTKAYWWSPFAKYALILNSKSDAEKLLKKYVYGNIQIKQI